jgi:hypothetical protein
MKPELYAHILHTLVTYRIHFNTKSVPLLAMQTLSSYSFLTSALDGECGQRHALTTLYHPERTPCIHWIGGWVGLSADLDTEAKGKTFAYAGDQTPVVQILTIKLIDGAKSFLIG